MKEEKLRVCDALRDQNRIYAYGISESGQSEVQAILNVKAYLKDDIRFSIRRAKDAFVPLVKSGSVELRFIAAGKMNLVDVWLDFKSREDIRIRELIGCRVVQLRNFVRVGTELNIRVFAIQGNREIEIVRKENENISGSGMKFYSTEHIATDAGLRIFLDTAPSETIVIHSTVVRCFQDNKSGVYTIAVRFLKTSEETRDKILQFILACLGRQINQMAFEECILTG